MVTLSNNINNPESGKIMGGQLVFRKLSDPNDNLLTAIYKRMFRYAAPNLFIWGPIVPAHDALFARSTLAVIQCSLGLSVLYGTFRRYGPSVGTLRRRISRISCFAGGSSLCLFSVRELLYSYDPNSNPLYIETRLARDFAVLNGAPNRGSYWNGPENFMPMNNLQYWKMLYTLETNYIMSEEYEESSLMEKYKELLVKSKVDERESLSSKISNIVNNETPLVKAHENVDWSPFVPFKVDSSQNLNEFWAKNNPLNILRFVHFADSVEYEFPRMKLIEEEEKKKQEKIDNERRTEA